MLLPVAWKTQTRNVVSFDITFLSFACWSAGIETGTRYLCEYLIVIQKVICRKLCLSACFCQFRKHASSFGITNSCSAALFGSFHIMKYLPFKVSVMCRKQKKNYMVGRQLAHSFSQTQSHRPDSVDRCIIMTTYVSTRQTPISQSV